MSEWSQSPRKNSDRKVPIKKKPQTFLKRKQVYDPKTSDSFKQGGRRHAPQNP